MHQMNDYQISFDDAEMISPSNDTAFKMSVGPYQHLNPNYEYKIDLLIKDKDYTSKGSSLDNRMHEFQPNSDSLETSPSKRMEA
jgi:hypothetical protein